MSRFSISGRRPPHEHGASDVTNLRVLHVSSGNLFGGVEAMLLALARHPTGPVAMDTKIALCHPGRLSQALTGGGTPALMLPSPRASRPLTVWRAREGLAELLARRPFDCVVCHAPWAHAIFGPAVRDADVPLALWVHGPVSGRHWSERWAGWTPPDLVICASRFVAGTVHTLYRHVPTVVVHPPVDVSPRSVPVLERRRIREELNTPEAAVTIIQSSRIEAWKGHAVLLDALGRLRDEPRWVCWQVGGPQRVFEIAYLESLRDRARRLGIDDRVRFVGERSDVPRLLAAADIHCQANLRPEPFGIAFVEALAAGLPVVTTVTGGATEIVDESCGFLVQPGDPAALARALKQLIDDPSLRARLAAGAPTRARRVSDPARQIGLLREALSTLGSTLSPTGAIAAMAIS
jgi:glycosyltransferase involved in cell wall biosynthesis